MAMKTVHAFSLREINNDQEFKMSAIELLDYFHQVVTSYDSQDEKTHETCYDYLNDSVTQISYNTKNISLEYDMLHIYDAPNYEVCEKLKVMYNVVRIGNKEYEFLTFSR